MWLMSSVTVTEGRNKSANEISLGKSGYMNHARIAAEAIRFRITTIRRPLVDAETIDVDAMAAASVSLGSPEVDASLRLIATAWQQAGFELRALGLPWSGDAAEFLKSRPDLIDAIDVIVAGASQATQAA